MPRYQRFLTLGFTPIVTVASVAFVPSLLNETDVDGGGTQSLAVRS